MKTKKQSLSERIRLIMKFGGLRCNPKEMSGNDKVWTYNDLKEIECELKEAVRELMGGGRFMRGNEGLFVSVREIKEIFGDKLTGEEDDS